MDRAKGAEAYEPIPMGQSKWADSHWPGQREPRRDDRAERADLRKPSQVGKESLGKESRADKAKLRGSIQMHRSTKKRLKPSDNTRRAEAKWADPAASVLNRGGRVKLARFKCIKSDSPGANVDCRAKLKMGDRSKHKQTSRATIKCERSFGLGQLHRSEWRWMLRCR